MKLSTAIRTKAEKQAIQANKDSQDFINTTNEWLRKLSESIDILKKDLQIHISDVCSKIKYQDIQIEKLTSSNEVDRKQLKSALDQVSTRSWSAIAISDKALETANVVSIKIDETIKKISSYSEVISELQNEISRLEQLITSEVLRIVNMLESKSKSIVTEISTLPSEVPGLKIWISESLQVFNTNISGYLRELDVVKKKTFINEKHFEYLTTELNKVKAGLH